jgi:hypothetical protein
MIFFTREIYEDYQERSGWTRIASRRANRNFKLYEKYFRVIRPFLPDSAVRFAKVSLHDSELAAWRYRGGRLHLVLDTSGVVVPLPGR